MLRQEPRSRNLQQSFGALPIIMIATHVFPMAQLSLILASPLRVRSYSWFCLVKPIHHLLILSQDFSLGFFSIGIFGPKCSVNTVKARIVALRRYLGPLAFSDIDKPVDEMLIIKLNVVHFHIRLFTFSPGVVGRMVYCMSVLLL